jgi:ParB/RepB/Spo0J family partition protein
MTTQIQITHIPLSSIEISPLNARKHFDQVALLELSDAILAKGVLQPILVRDVGEGIYEIVAGERRYRASIIAKLTDIPCIIRDLNEDEALDIMLMENIQREDLHPIEEANGFRTIMEVKHIDIKELAARVGKTKRYVAQRLKLCDLIDPIQQHFFNGLLLVKDALTLSQLRAEDQQALYDDQMAGSDQLLELDEWVIDKYQHRLDRATFDILDPDLIKGKPSCTVCPYNSASSLLFPDQSTEPICHDASCYRAKCDRAFEITLTSLPAGTLQITGQHFKHQKIDKDTQRLIPSLTHFLPIDAYTEVQAPEPPDRDDFNGDNDTEEEDQADYERRLKEYQLELADFIKKVKSGKYTPAFVVGGHRKGQYVYVEIDHTSGTQPDKPEKTLDPADMTADDITEAIRTLQRREMVDIHAADQSRWEEILPLADPSTYVSAAANQKLTAVELQAIARAMYGAIDYEYESAFRTLFFGADDGEIIPDGYLKAPHLLSDMLRFFLVATLQPHYIGGDGDRHQSQLLEACLVQHFKQAIDDIDTMHHARSQARQDQVSARIKVLEKKLKALQPPPKKGKGIRALIASLLLLLTTSFASCTQEEIALPLCTRITTEQYGNKLRMQIDSDSPHITLVHQDGRELHIVRHYYRCVSLTVYPDEVITIIDGVEECHIITGLNTTSHDL